MASFQEENRSMMTCEQSWLDPKVGFQPTDQQLITYFLKKKISGNPLPMNMVIDEVQFRNYNPTQLSKMYGFANQKELYFFTPLFRKYRNSDVVERKAGDGYWKSISREQQIEEENVIIGYKRLLQFYNGRKQKHSSKTNFYMFEYNMGVHAPTESAFLYEWVLCKVYEEKGENDTVPNLNSDDHTAEDVAGAQLLLDLKMHYCERKKRRLVPIELSELSFDIIIEILSWLPVASLLKFKCVCKQWCSLIGKHEFIAKHMDRASPIQISYQYKWDPPTLLYDENFECISAYAGLFLEKSVDSQVYRIRNHATHQVLYLPHAHDGTRSMGFVFNSSTGECKVVCRFKCKNDGSRGYKVITVGKDDQWRPTKFPDRKEAVLKRNHFRVSEVDGAAHMVETIRDGQDLYLEVQSFDIWSESITTTALPRGVSLDLENVSVLSWNVETLAVAGIVEESLNVLVLEDFKEHKWSENKKIPLKFLKDDPLLKDQLRLRHARWDELVFYNAVEENIVRYDMKREKIKVTTESKGSMGEYSTYKKPSLVTLKGMRLKSATLDKL